MDEIAAAIEQAVSRPVAAGVDDQTTRYAYDNLAVAVARVIEEVTEQRARPSSAPAPVAAPEAADAALSVMQIAYYFPPVGGAGAQRSLKFVRYLPESGCRSVVVTGTGGTTGRWTPSDETLSDEIPDGTSLLRIGGAEPAGPSGWRGRINRWLRIRSAWSRWWTRGIIDMAAEPDMSSVDVILASASPYDTLEAAAKLSRRLGKPWVAGLRDPWALDEMMIYPTGIHRRLEIALMRRLLGTAAAIVMTTPEAARQVAEAFPELRDRPIVSIPNGYDAADFADGTVAPHDPGKFRIVHTGYLHTELGLQQQRGAGLRRLLGGATPGVEILTRSHVYLLKAVEQLVERDPSLADRLELHFAGVLSGVDRELAAASPQSVLHGYLSHADSIALMRSADLLFLPMQNLPPGRRSSTVPGKTYEYLATGRPILAAVPPSDTSDILQAVGHTVCGPDDIDGIAAAIAAAIARSDTGVASPELNWDVVRTFERRVIARQLAALLRTVVADADASATTKS